MKILSYFGKHYEGIFIGMAMGNFVWWVQPNFSQGLQLIREGVQATFLGIGMIPLLFLVMIKGYIAIKRKKVVKQNQTEVKK